MWMNYLIHQKRKNSQDNLKIGLKKESESLKSSQNGNMSSNIIAKLNLNSAKGT